MGAMGLTLPTDHQSLDAWGAILNTALGLVEAHNHTAGNGNLVPTGGLSIDADLAFNTKAITGLKAIDFTAVATTAVTGYAGAFFVNSADSNLYYRTTAGVNVQVTNGAALNVSAFTGGIGGDYASVGALFSFDDATDSYWAQQELVLGVRAWAGLRVGNVDIYEQAASITNRVRLNSPTALAASYALTLPAALGGSTLALQVSSAGVMSLSNSFASSLTAPDFLYTTAQEAVILGGDFEDVTAGTHTKFNSAIGAHVGWTLSASANVLSVSLPVRVGDIITGYVLYINKTTNAAVTLTARIYRTRGSTTPGSETAVSSGVSESGNAPGFTTMNETGLSHTVVAGYQYYLVFTPSAVNGGDVLYGGGVDVKRA